MFCSQFSMFFKINCTKTLNMINVSLTNQFSVGKISWNLIVFVNFLIVFILSRGKFGSTLICCFRGHCIHVETPIDCAHSSSDQISIWALATAAQSHAFVHAHCHTGEALFQRYQNLLQSLQSKLLVLITRLLEMYKSSLINPDCLNPKHPILFFSFGDTRKTDYNFAVQICF